MSLQSSFTDRNPEFDGSGGLIARQPQLSKILALFRSLSGDCSANWAKAKSSPRLAASTLVYDPYFRICLGTNNMLNSKQTQHSTDQKKKSTKTDDKKGMSGLLRSLLLKEPSGLALTRAQADHKLSAKSKSTNRRSAETTPVLSLKSRPSISSSSVSSKTSKP